MSHMNLSKLADTKTVEPKPLSQSFALSGSQQKEKLETSTIVQWANNMMSIPNESITKGIEPENTSLMLSRFGLKNAEDVIRFLKSPAGETVRTELIEHLVKEEEIKEEQKFQDIEHSYLMQRIRIFLILLIVAEETKAADFIKELTTQQNEKSLKDSEKIIKDNAASSSDEARRKEFAKTIEHYNQAISGVDKKIQENQLEEQKLQAKTEQLKEQGQQIKNKYAEFNKGLDELGQESEDLDKMSKQDLEQKIKKLQENLDIQSAQMIEEPDDKKRMELKDQYNTNVMKLGEYRDRLDIKNGNKYYVDANGETVDSAEKAEYLLPKEQKIVVENGTTFLLKQGESLENMSAEDKEKAHQNFERSKPQFQIVKKLVESNKNIEDNIYKGEVDKHSHLVDNNKKELLQLQQLAKSLLSGKTKVEDAMKQLDPAHASSKQQIAVSKMNDTKPHSDPFDELEKYNKKQKDMTESLSDSPSESKNVQLT